MKFSAFRGRKKREHRVLTIKSPGGKREHRVSTIKKVAQKEANITFQQLLKRDARVFSC